jgi:hypothetical protein
MKTSVFTAVRTIGAIALGSFMLVPACSINAKKGQNGEDKQVDISTPIGGIHVSKDADSSDVGLPIYPGARLRQENAGDNKSANVNISGFGFGLKVVALEYESNDAPDKIIKFYQEPLKKYGEILVCHTSGFDVNTDVKTGDEKSHTLTCESSSGNNTELKAGTRENQHIVAVKPQGKGSDFSLVYVRTHGKDADI